jgi:hypothetical protein
MQSESNSGEEFQELQDARPCPLLEMSDRLCIADLADLNSTKNEQEAPSPRPLMMVNIVNVKTDEIRDCPVNIVSVVNMVNVVNVKMVKIRINRDSLSESGAAFLWQLINQGIEITESILAHIG